MPMPKPPPMSREDEVNLFLDAAKRAVAKIPVAEPPPDIGPLKDHNGTLTADETKIILRSTLLPEHRDDPNILRFISNYIRCRNSKQAAVEAGLNARDGYTLRKKPDIHKCIEELTAKSVMKYGYDATEVVERVKEIAGIDPLDIFNEDGTIKTNMADIPPEARRAIKSFKVKNIWEEDPNGLPRLKGQVIEVQLWDKMKAQELLGREKDIFKETKKVQHDVTDNMASLLLESTRRADERINQLTDVTPQRLLEGDTEE